MALHVMRVTTVLLLLLLLLLRGAALGTLMATLVGCGGGTTCETGAGWTEALLGCRPPSCAGLWWEVWGEGWPGLLLRNGGSRVHPGLHSTRQRAVWRRGRGHHSSRGP